jgi:hypothetical protein
MVVWRSSEEVPRLNLHKDAYRRWLSSERDAHYWECLSSKMEALDGRFSIASGIFSSAAFVAFISNSVVDLGLPLAAKGLLTGGFAILGAALSFYSRHKSYGKKAAKFAMLHGMALQQIESWKYIRDAVLEGGAVSDDLVREVRARDSALLAHEAGHKVDEPLALACENKVRQLEGVFKKGYLEEALNEREEAPRLDRIREAT